MKIKKLTEIEKLAKEGELTLNPEKPALIFGLSTCGIASGGNKVKKFAEDYLAEKGFDAEVSVVGCIGLCHAEPLVDVKLPGMPRLTYHSMDEEKMKKVMDQHLMGGKPVKEYALAQLSSELSACEQGVVNSKKRYEGIPDYTELPFFSKQVRIALRNCGIINPDDIKQYMARGGYRAILKVMNDMTPDEGIEDMKLSGLRGRGGAGFPTGLKWQFARTAMGDKKYVICNADEGDPGAYMDRAVLEGDPHNVIEGMMIGAYLMGASEGYIYIRAEYPLAIERLKLALAEAREMGLLGENIAGSQFGFDIHIREGAGVFVCGEETALIRSIEGKRGEPRPRPPFPATKGLWGKPTNINNVETWANVPLILLRGGKWFSGMGTEKSKGTKVFSLVGKINRPGLIEVPMGIRMRDIIYEIGGGIPDGRKFKAVQTGGPSGGCVPVGKLDVEVDYENLKELGSIVGSGGMVVMDEDTCMVDVARYFLSFTSEESCGQCTPCRIGTRKMLDILTRITKGKGKESDIALLEHLSVQIRDSSLCALGGTAPNPVLTTLKYFRKEYEEHISDKYCRSSVCASMFRAPCQNTCPAGTDVPGYIQLICEGRYGDAYDLNRQDNPFPSICGRVCEHPCEERCQRNQLDESVAIRDLKRYCSDRAIEEPGSVPEPTRLDRNDKAVAIVGGGPSGLTAAYFLARLGYSPTIFESNEKLGGMLRYGIPTYRLPHDILDREINDILELGVEVLCNCSVGRDTKILQLIDEYDAVYLAVGAQRDKALGIENEDLPGIIPGLKLLKDINSGKNVDLGDSLLIIGGGNVAIDVARSALRMGCKSVQICYRREEREMPAYREEIEAAKEEGIKFHFLVAPEKVMNQKGRAVGMVFQKMKMGDYTNDGRRRPVPTGQKMEIKADAIVTAIGQDIDPGFSESVTERLMGQDGWINVKEGTFATDLVNVFAGGDAVIGPASVIEAIAHGKEAAGNIDLFLSGENRLLKLRELAAITYSMVEPKGNDKKLARQLPKELAAAKRKGNFNEVVQCLENGCAKKEAERCLRCDIASEEVE